MALDDILLAITQHADSELAKARAAHEQRIAEMRETSQREIERKEREVTLQKEQKLAHSRQKADAYATTLVRHAALNAKQRALDDIYRSVATALEEAPESTVEPLLKACLKNLPASGEIRPARAHAAILKKLVNKDHAIGEPIDAAGGFVFVSKDRDVDCTFATLTERVLRPATELEISASLFSA